jgi:hypothetical protein
MSRDEKADASVIVTIVPVSFVEDRMTVALFHSSGILCVDQRKFRILKNIDLTFFEYI